MRYTFYTENFSNAEHALVRAKALVEGMTGAPSPCFSIDEGDGGYCVYHTSKVRTFTDKTLTMTILVHFAGPGVTVEGFLADVVE